MAISTACPSGHCARTSEKAAGRGQAMGLRSFLTMPSASAVSRPKAIASAKLSKATIISTQGHAGASGISSAVMIPVVP